MSRWTKFLRLASLAVGLALTTALLLGATAGSSDPNALQPTLGRAQPLESRTYDMQPVAPYEFRGDVRDLAKLPSAPAGLPHYLPLLQGPPYTMQAPAGQAAAESINIPLAPMPSPIAELCRSEFQR